WWGHRIPAWYCESCGHMMVARSAPDVCTKCGSENIHQDEDVLDTWFSSALWAFSTLGWPEMTDDLKYFYPTDVLVTGYDIIFFWVARMIFSGLEQMDEKPFDHVLIHGLVRDEQGRKMSKSLDNGIDPLEVINQYGADALRFSLTIGTSPGNDMRFSSDKAESARNFTNKVWNASRYVLSNLGEDVPQDIKDVQLNLIDEWILTRLNETSKEVCRHMDSYDLGLACSKAHDFFKNEFCDWYIEFSKQTLYKGTALEQSSTKAVLCKVLKDSLKTLHPFIPFVTEEIWQNIPGASESIMMETWPTYNADYIFEQSSKNIHDLMEIIHAIRNIRAEMKVPTGKKTLIVLNVSKESEFLTTCDKYVESLAHGNKVVFAKNIANYDEYVSAQCLAAEVLIPLGELVDMEKEKARLEKEIGRAELEIKKSTGKLSNEGFTKKAPPAVVDREKQLLENHQKLLADLKNRLESL
ncbi:MAG: class I tRNA ligase family protein, partial [Clostridiales bacterium]|nr:class I tRNA ligase family protein [Clostridiales bacterium]